VRTRLPHGRSVIGIAAIAGVVALGAPVGLAQQPQWSPLPRMNLKVLPETTDDRTLIATMRGFSQGLGVRCQHCHVHKGENPDDLSTFDFASDEKAAKETARTMLRMVAAINDEHLEGVGEARAAGELKVTCYTCHRGEMQPLTRRPQQ